VVNAALLMHALVKPSAGAERRTGVLLSIGAYTLWGAFPIYFKLLHAPPLEVLAHRVVWSALSLAAVLAAQRRVRALYASLTRRVVLGSLVSGALLGVNWFIYIWAVSMARVVDASLGYFITPLVSVVIAMLFFGESLRLGQRLAIVTAAAGVAWLTLQFGQLPWVGLSLAFSFGTYGALRKIGVLGSLEGLLLEQVLMLPFAIGYIAWLSAHGALAFGNTSTGQATLLALTGPLSSVPLIMFAAGARKIPFSLVGLLQYISPTLQLLCGVLVWHEPMGGVRLVGYALIWLALVIYSLEGAWAAKLRRRRSSETATSQMTGS
jgi:chloramphenicol-sensitive protein RarD